MVIENEIKVESATIKVPVHSLGELASLIKDDIDQQRRVEVTVTELSARVQEWVKFYKEYQDCSERREGRMWKLLWGLFVLNAALAGINVGNLVGLI